MGGRKILTIYKEIMKIKTINHQDKFKPEKDIILGSVIAPDEPINGYYQNDLGDIWWETLLGISADKNPLLYDDITDPNKAKGSSEKASLTRIDSIQLLAGVFNESGTAERTIKVPGGSVFFLPILNGLNPDPYVNVKNGRLAGGIGGFDQDGNLITETSAREDLADLINTINELHVSIDGVSIPNVFDYRQQSDQPFFYNLPVNNVYGLKFKSEKGTFGGVVADGYWMGIGNLSPENHVIKFGGSLPDFKLDITYNISFELNPIVGTNRRDYITGTNGWDEIKGLNDNDYIVGLEGNDVLYGGDGNDTLIGVNPHTYHPGVGEIDILVGGNGSDTFVLGNKHNVFYAEKELQDYAIIRDFQTEDKIQLHGNSWIYELDKTYSLGGKSGTSIFVKDTYELIGFVEGVTNLNLASNDFNFACF